MLMWTFTGSSCKGRLLEVVSNGREQLVRWQALAKP